MPCPISNTLKTYALAWLVVLVTGLPLGNINSSFAETTMDAEIIMAIDSSENLGDEAEMFNNILNVFTAAFVASDGALEVMVMDRHSICISARMSSGGCSKNAPPWYRYVATDMENHDARVTILSAYDE